MSRDFRLTIELVPSPCWGNSLRTADPNQWKKLRKEIATQYQHKCVICDADCSGKWELKCHEVWDYDDLTHVQRLKEIVALCYLCDRVKHLGKTRDLAAKGKLDIREVEAHFTKVNKCDLATFREYEAQSLVQFLERSKHQWTLDFGDYEELSKAPSPNRVYEPPHDYGPNPGDYMPDTCQYCGSVGSLFLIKEDWNDDWSEGEIAEYESGMAGYAACLKCHRRFRWQI